jgi:hypothetical protein
MVRIEIEKVEITEKSGTIRKGDRAGQSYNIRSQEGYLHNGARYPVKVVLSIADNQAEPYPVGFYTLSEASFVAGDFDKPELARFLTLVPETAVAAVRKGS